LVVAAWVDDQVAEDFSGSGVDIDDWKSHEREDERSSVLPTGAADI
jgi:hypothetical protein